MTEKKTAPLTAEAQKHYQTMADWAENEMNPLPESATALHGRDAAAHARAMLVEAGIDAVELNRLIGGRPNLDPDAMPGRHSPQINLRVTAGLKQQLKDLADERGTSSSDLARELLTAGVRRLQKPHKHTSPQENIPS